MNHITTMMAKTHQEDDDDDMMLISSCLSMGLGWAGLVLVVACGLEKNAKRGEVRWVDLWKGEGD